MDLELADDKRDVYPAIAGSPGIEPGLFPGYAVHNHNNLVLVGCPMGTDEFIREHVRGNTEKANELVETLNGIPDAQAGLLILRYCANYAKLVYLSRVIHPSHTATQMAEHDKATRESLSDLPKADLEEDNWFLATKCVRDGGGEGSEA